MTSPSVHERPGVFEIGPDELAALGRGDVAAFHDDPGYRLAAEAVTSPTFRVDLAIIAPAALTGVFPGWVGTRMAVLTARGTTLRYSLSILPRRALPNELARLVRLGPRPRGEFAELVRIAPDRVEGFFDGTLDAEEALELSDDVPAALAEVLETLPESVLARWRVEVADASTRSLASIEVVDAGQKGLWQLVPDSGDATYLASTTPELVWMQFCALAVPDGERVANL